MLVLAISVLVINSSKKIVKMLCTYYLVQFEKKQRKTLFNSRNKVNAMSPDIVEKLGPQVWKTNIGVQKIDGSMLEIFGIVIANF